MFESDQFHQFIDSRTSATNNSILSFPNPFHQSSASAISAFSSFDSFSNSSSQDVTFLHQPKTQHKDSTLLPMNLDTTQRDRDRSAQEWSADEILTLLRIRSTMENNWFPDLTWDHVSRKLAEFGFKRSADKCKEKFEEESRYFNNISTPNFPKNCRVFGEFEDLYQAQEMNHNQADKDKKIDKLPNQEQEQKIDQTDEKSKGSTAKRKRDQISSSNSSFDQMFKGFCQDIIGKIIAQQEEMHSKLLEDIAKRDEEKVAREEQWKKQELDRFDKELQLRAQQQALSTDRQTTIINFLKRFSSDSTFEDKSSSSSISSSAQNPNPNPNPNSKDPNFSTPNWNPSKPNSIQSPNHQNPNPIPNPEQQKDSNFSTPNSNPGKPNSIPSPNHQNPNSPSQQSPNDLGKRWPKDEVLALINLRCSVNNNGSNEDQDKESSSSSVKAPLWERISKGMMELGYRRSAKRCKEKWENINKYFRKTKDSNKKRSSDSRTCPYFHQLSTLYNQGKLAAAASSDVGTESTNSTLVNHQQASEGDQNLAQASGFEFEF